jgi:hypothetical protein
MLALTSPSSGGRSVGIVRLRTQAAEVIFVLVIFLSSSWIFQSGSKFVILYFGQISVIKVDIPVCPKLVNHPSLWLTFCL